MSEIVYEVLDGGLVTSEAPSQLQPGELVVATNALYYPWRSGVASQPAVTEWGLVASANQEVKGLTSARFDNGTHYLVAMASAKYWLADAETDGSSFASATSVTAGNQLVAVEYDNRYYMLNGSGENLVLQQDGTFRKHGLQPVTSQLTLIGTAASAFSGSATGFYEYWFTEVVRFADNSELESAYEAGAGPLTVEVTSLSVSPRFEIHGNPVNLGQGVHISYRVYRSEKKTLRNDGLYPVGTKILEESATLADGSARTPVQFTDATNTSNIGVKVAASNGTAVVQGAVATSLTGAAASIAQAVSATGDGKEWLVSATGSVSANTFETGAGVQLFNFSPGTITGNIAGIEVVVRAAGNVADIADVWVSVGKKNATYGLTPLPPNAQWPSGVQLSILPQSPSPALRTLNSRTAKHKTVTTTVLASGDLTFGGAADNWIPPGHGWPLDWFTSDWTVEVGVVFNYKAVSGDRVWIDYVRCNIYYTGTTTDKQKGKLFDSISIEQGGSALHFSANGKPPVASTGCVFEGSLVTDDVEHPGKLVWSVPNWPDYFPTGVYFNVLPEGNNDIITFLGIVNDRCICGTRGSLWRVNYLPNEMDASFNRGRAISLISDRIGILRPTAACIFTNPDGYQELAFVDTTGVYATNGYTIRSLSEDLRWVGISEGVFGAITSSIYSNVKALINDPTTQTLRMVMGNGYYAASYAPRHKKMSRDGVRLGMKWSGPCDSTLASIQPACAHVFRRDTGVWVVVYGHKTSSGKVSREDSNDTTSYNTSPAMLLETREIFPAGLGQEVSLDALIVEARDIGAGVLDTQSPTWTATIEQYFTNAAPPTDVVLTYATHDVDVEITERPCGSVNANGFSVQLAPVSETGKRVEVSRLGFSLTPFGGAELRA